MQSDGTKADGISFLQGGLLVETAHRHFLFLVSLIVFLGHTVTVQAQRPSAHRRVLVGFRDASGPHTPQERADTVRRRGGTVHRSLRIVPVVSATLSDQAIEQLRSRVDVEYVEEDVVLYAAAQAAPWGVDRIDADLVWPTGNTGQGVKVAILDTGIDYDHPDLAVAGGVNFVGSIRDGSTNPTDWNDNHGHGTHCAGIVAARNNAMGVVGVAPDASLWGVKILNDNGSGYTSDIIQGLDWCVSNGIRVASMSITGPSTASFQSACDRAYAAGVLLVAAAGNSGGTVGYPAAYASVLAVSATDSQDRRAYFSSNGPQIELGAPGVSIPSTYKGGGYAYMSGTSMACPHVVGAAALVWASGFGSAAAVRERLTSTAEDLEPSGFDTSFGYGLVDAQRAAGGTSSPPPAPVDKPPTVDIASPAQGSTVSGTVLVRADATDDKGVTQVEFLVDGVRIGLDTYSGDGWTASWNTIVSIDGQHTLAARATDTTGQTTTDSITVTVGNADALPSVQITTPQNGTTVSGGITISAASDDKGVVSVTFTVDGRTIAVDSDGGNGWSASWDTTSAADGNHTVTAVATDTKGQTASHSVLVTVKNVAPPTGTTASVRSITYSTAGGYAEDRDLYITLYVENDQGSPVENASAFVAIYLNGRINQVLSARTDASGSATLRIVYASSGSYETRIYSLTAAGLTWDGVTPPNGFTK